MKYIEPQVEWWHQTTLAQHIARVGRICYKAKGKQPEEGMTEEEVEAFIQKRDEERCKGFWESGHCSMYRHGTVYFFMPNEKGLPNYIWAYLNASPTSTMPQRTTKYGLALICSSCLRTRT